MTTFNTIMMWLALGGPAAIMLIIFISAVVGILWPAPRRLPARPVLRPAPPAPERPACRSDYHLAG